MFAALVPSVGNASANHFTTPSHPQQSISYHQGALDEAHEEHRHAGFETSCAIASGHCVVAGVVPLIPHHDFARGVVSNRAAQSHETREGIDLGNDPPPPRS